MNLKVKSKKVNDFTYELSISVPWKDLKEDFESAKKKTSKEIKVSGFSCLLYTSPSPRDGLLSRMPSSA